MTSLRKVACPSCKVGLRIADTVTAGKRIRCPKCSNIFVVPVGERPATIRAPQPEEPEHEEEERSQSRRRAKNKKKPARSVPLVLGLGIGGGVLVLGVVVMLAFIRPWEAKARTVVGNDPRPAPPPSMRPPFEPEPVNPGTSAPTGEPGPAVKVANAGDATSFAAGRKVYDALDCSRCHSLGGGPGGGKRGRGPNLAHVGADPGHTVAWLSEQIRDPHSHRPNSRMPDYGDDKLSREDLRSLSEYLASLK
jgi:mono/diheme cytochrome c family protein